MEANKWEGIGRTKFGCLKGGVFVEQLQQALNDDRLAGTSEEGKATVSMPRLIPRASTHSLILGRVYRHDRCPA